MVEEDHEETMPQLPPLMTTKDVAKRLGVTIATVCNYIHRGQLAAFTEHKPFLIRREDYLKFKTEVWPTLTMGRRAPRGKVQKMSLNDMMRIVEMSRELKRLMKGRK